jgi:hypothetical protein
VERRISPALVIADGEILLHRPRERALAGAQHFVLPIACVHSTARRVRAEGADERKGVGRFYGCDAEVTHRFNACSTGMESSLIWRDSVRTLTPMRLAMMTSARNGIINAA